MGINRHIHDEELPTSLREDLPLGMMIKMVSHLHERDVRERHENSGIQRSFGQLIMEISHHEGATQAEIASFMNFSAPSISVTIKKMEENGLIEKKSDENDQRQTRIYLTDKGFEYKDRIKAVFRETEQTLSKDLTEEDQATLRKLLIKIYNSIRN